MVVALDTNIAVEFLRGNDKIINNFLEIVK